jgi:perosamine synthetase
MHIGQIKPYIDLKEYEGIKECFEEGWLTEGKKAEEFTKKLRDIIGVNYGVLTPNCTLGLYLGLKAMGVGPGDEVIVPNFTFIASANSVQMVGATPVFCDVKVSDLQIDVNYCEKYNLVTEKTKAIMPVHMYGMACNMEEVNNFAIRYNLKIIEDAAQAFGVSWNGRMCGSFGEVGCFSFFIDKTITTIEGGFISTDSKEIYEKLIYLRNQGRLNRGTFIHPEIGYNFRMTDIQAAIGLTQLEKSGFIFREKYEKYRIYDKYLKGIKDIKILSPNFRSNYIPFRVVIFCEGDQQDLSDFLKLKGIESRTLFYPLHKQPCYQYLNITREYPNSEYAFRHGLCLPSYPQLLEKEIKYICDSIKEYYSR